MLITGVTCTKHHSRPDWGADIHVARGRRIPGYPTLQSLSVCVPAGRRWPSRVGIGVMGAAMLLGEIGDPRAFAETARSTAGGAARQSRSPLDQGALLRASAARRPAGGRRPRRVPAVRLAQGMVDPVRRRFSQDTRGASRPEMRLRSTASAGCCFRGAEHGQEASHYVLCRRAA